MIFRTNNNKLVEVKKHDFKTDKEYYKYIIDIINNKTPKLMKIKNKLNNDFNSKGEYVATSTSNDKDFTNKFLL